MVDAFDRAILQYGAAYNNRRVGHWMSGWIRQLATIPEIRSAQLPGF
jgi:hypothetical protein